MMMVSPSAPGGRSPVLVLVTILPLWDLDPSELRIAFKHLFFFTSLTLLLRSARFLPAATSPDSLFHFVLFLSVEVTC